MPNTHTHTHTHIYISTVLFQTIQFSISTVSMSNSSIWSIDRTLSGATTPGQSGPQSNANEGVLCIPQSSSIIGASPSDCLVPYPGHSWWWWGSYFSEEMQLVYSTASADWAQTILGCIPLKIIQLIFMVLIHSDKLKFIILLFNEYQRNIIRNFNSFSS